MLKGDRVRYVGHVPGCVSCNFAVSKKPKAIDASGLDDFDEFGGGDYPDAWDERVGKLGTLAGPSLGASIWVKFDDELGTVNAYVSHLEIVRE